MARALRITWLEPDYPNLSKVEDVNNVGKKLCLVCDSISTTTTFTAEACQNFRKAPWIATPKKYYIYRNSKSVVASSTLGKKKLNFAAGWTIATVNIEHLKKGNQKVPEKRFHAHYCLDGHSGSEDWNFVIFEQFETHEQLKERETFWQHKLKIFYPIGLNKKEEYLY